MRSGGGGTLDSTPASRPALSPPPLSPASAHDLTWNSPVPFLLGGLAAMLGLVVLALLILAYSQWHRLFRPLNAGDGAGYGKPGNCSAAAPPVLEEKIAVIMAGDDKPTFLATPASLAAAPCPPDEEKPKQQEIAVLSPRSNVEETQ